MLNIGLLGCGRIGQVHGKTLKGMSTARAAAVSDFLPEAATALAAELGATVMTSDQMLSDPDIDAVVIGTPTTTHFDLIHQAAANGKAIFCEKPVDLSVDRIRECLQAVQTAGVPFMTAFNRRFDPNFAHLKSQIDDQVIGNVEILTILSRDPAPPPIDYIKTSGGIFRDMVMINVSKCMDQWACCVPIICWKIPSSCQTDQGLKPRRHSHFFLSDTPRHTVQKWNILLMLSFRGL